MSVWSPSWVVARTAPEFAAERRAMTHAARLEFPTYHPQYRQLVVSGGRKALRVRSLFPGYLFVFVRDIWYDLLRLPGISGLLMDGERPARLPSAEIDALRHKHDAEGYVRLPRLSAECFSKGQRVRVRSGPFTGLDGVYEGMSARGREILLLGVLGAQRRTELAPETSLEAG